MVEHPRPLWSRIATARSVNGVVGDGVGVGRVGEQLRQRPGRQRIARILHDHIEELLVGVKRRKAPLKPTQEKTVRQASQDVQNFIDQSIARRDDAGHRHLFCELCRKRDILCCYWPVTADRMWASAEAEGSCMMNKYKSSDD